MIELSLFNQSIDQIVFFDFNCFDKNKMNFQYDHNYHKSKMHASGFGAG